MSVLVLGILNVYLFVEKLMTAVIISSLINTNVTAFPSADDSSSLRICERETIRVFYITSVIKCLGVEGIKKSV
jgi:hypothetical protein